jgi:hypothetical protein
MYCVRLGSVQMDKKGRWAPEPVCMRWRVEELLSLPGFELRSCVYKVAIPSNHATYHYSSTQYRMRSQ